MRLNTPLTSAPTQRVSQLPTGRGTIRVPTTLTAAVSTSKAPTTAATSRAAIGTAMGISSNLGWAQRWTATVTPTWRDRLLRHDVHDVGYFGQGTFEQFPYPPFQLTAPIQLRAYRRECAHTAWPSFR